MRIDRVRVDLVNLDRVNSIMVRIDTDAGITGTGETVLKRRDRSVEANLREIADAIIGTDPTAIEDRFEKLYRDTFWVGGPLHASGRSAVDIALWDIKGQALGAPVHQLLGGPTRSRILTYAHANAGASPEELVANIGSLVERGYRAVKTGLPLFYGRAAGAPPTGDGYFGTPGSIDPSLKETEYVPTATWKRVARWFEAVREAFGDELEVMVDCHGRLGLGDAVRLAEVLAPYDLLFIEEPLPPESPIAYAELTARSTTPIAAGERLTSGYEVRPWLERAAVRVLQCDVVNCGGITGARKIAAMAEAFHLPYAPHNPNGPIATLATAQVLASIPNALILETVGSESDARAFAEIVDHPPRVVDGYLMLDERPGLGAALLDDGVGRRPAGSYEASR